MTKPPRGTERGIALPLALLLLICLGLIASAAVFLSNTDQRISSSYSKSNNAVAAAEAAAEHGVTELTTRAQAGQDPDSVQILADTLGRFTYTVSAYSLLQVATTMGAGTPSLPAILRPARSTRSPTATTAAAPSPKRPLATMFGREVSSRCTVSEHSSTEIRTATSSGWPTR